jgi:hypothetical protein
LSAELSLSEIHTSTENSSSHLFSHRLESKSRQRLPNEPTGVGRISKEAAVLGIQFIDADRAAPDLWLPSTLHQTKHGAPLRLAITLALVAMGAAAAAEPLVIGKAYELPRVTACFGAASADALVRAKEAGADVLPGGCKIMDLHYFVFRAKAPDTFEVRTHDKTWRATFITGSSYIDGTYVHTFVLAPADIEVATTPSN